MTSKNDDKRKENLITDPNELKSILNTGNQKYINQAYNRMTKQAQQALQELQTQMIDLVAQILGFVPSSEQRRKHGKVEHRRGGGVVMYWDGTPFLKLSPVHAEKKIMRVGEQRQKIQFSQDYEIIKDDPIGYKKANPNDNYQSNHYPDDVDPTIN